MLVDAKAGFLAVGPVALKAMLLQERIDRLFVSIFVDNKSLLGTTAVRVTDNGVVELSL